MVQKLRLVPWNPCCIHIHICMSRTDHALRTPAPAMVTAAYTKQAACWERRESAQAQGLMGRPAGDTDSSPRIPLRSSRSGISLLRAAVVAKNGVRVRGRATAARPPRLVPGTHWSGRLGWAALGYTGKGQGMHLMAQSFRRLRRARISSGQHPMSPWTKLVLRNAPRMRAAGGPWRLESCVSRCSSSVVLFLAVAGPWPT